jgi:hypothetical protein
MKNPAVKILSASNLTKLVLDFKNQMPLFNVVTKSS